MDWQSVADEVSADVARLDAEIRQRRRELADLLGQRQRAIEARNYALRTCGATVPDEPSKSYAETYQEIASLAVAMGADGDISIPMVSTEYSNRFPERRITREAVRRVLEREALQGTLRVTNKGSVGRGNNKLFRTVAPQ